MLVREQGNDVCLMSALSPSWLRPGQGRRGAQRADRARPCQLPPPGEARRSPPDLALAVEPTELAGALRRREARAPGLSGGVIRLRGRSGALNVTWTLAGGSTLTFEKVAAALLTAYAHHRGGAATTGRNAVPTVSDSTLGN